MAERSRYLEQVPPIYHLPTWFYLDGKEWYHEEHGVFMLPIGSKVLSNDGHLYRVKDTWFSFDHHGRHPEGMHIFMEETKIDPSLIQPSDRDYYQLD
jgi:hypothetical protein